MVWVFYFCVLYFVLCSCFTKQVSVAVTHYIHIGVGWGFPRRYICCHITGFPKISIISAERNFWILLIYGCHRLHLSSFQFVILLSDIWSEILPGVGEELCCVTGCLLCKVSTTYSELVFRNKWSFEEFAPVLPLETICIYPFGA